MTWLKQSCFVRMDSERRIDPVVLFGVGNAARHLVGPVAVADCDQRLHAGSARALEHGFAVGSKLLTIDVGVGVDVHKVIFGFSNLDSKSRESRTSKITLILPRSALLRGTPLVRVCRLRSRPRATCLAIRFRGVFAEPGWRR